MKNVEPQVNKIILDRIKNFIADSCPKERYNFKTDDSDNHTVEAKVQYIPHKQLTEYLDSKKKRWRNRNKARLMSPYVKYSYNGMNADILSTVEYHLKEYNGKNNGMVTVEFEVYDKNMVSKNLRRYL